MEIESETDASKNSNENCIIKEKKLKPILKKKIKQSYDDENQKIVSFIDEKFGQNLHEVKPPTLVKEEESNSFEKDEIRIRKCKTIEDLNKIKGELLEEFASLKEFKNKKIDIDDKYEKFMLKLELVEQVNFEIEQRLMFDQKMEKEKLNQKQKQKHKENSINNMEKNRLRHELNQENAFDKMINSCLDLVILIEFDLPFSINRIIDYLKLFLKERQNQKIRFKVFYTNCTKFFFNEVFDSSNKDETWLNLEGNIYDIIKECYWEPKTWCLRLFIWEKSLNFYASNLYKAHNSRIYSKKLNFSIPSFEIDIQESFDKNALEDLFETIKLKNIFDDLFIFKRNNFQQKDEIKVPKYALIINQIKDLKNNKCSSSKLCLNSSSRYELVNDYSIFYASKCSYFGRFFNNPKSDLWLEYFPNMKINFQFEKIYQLTLNYVNQFNKLFKRPPIVLNKAFFLYDDCKKMTWYANETFLDITINKRLDHSFLDHDIQQSFMHFCHSNSEGKLIIFDLRPVYYQNENYLLFTEPIVQSDKMDTDKYSNANFGSNGIEYFFTKRHKCNELCKIIFNKDF